LTTFFLTFVKIVFDPINLSPLVQDGENIYEEAMRAQMEFEKRRKLEATNWLMDHQHTTQAIAGATDRDRNGKVVRYFNGFRQGQLDDHQVS
jgi:hypothetical protein